MTSGEDPRFSRYQRQMLFAPFGAQGQEKLASARVGLVGCGALGSVIANHLVRAGVGYVRLVDRDFLELNNLQRQMLFTESDVRERIPKAEAAAGHLREINSDVTVDPVVADINPFSIVEFGDGLDLLVDGTDNFTTRFLINDYCVSRGIPWVYGGVIMASGMTMTLVPGEGHCLRCVFPELPPPGSAPTCDTVGVLNTAVAVVASLEANEVFKLILDPGSRNKGLLTVDLWNLAFETVEVKRDPECPACGRGLFPFLGGDHEESAVSLCGRDAVQIVPVSSRVLDLGALRSRLAGVGPVRANPFLVELDVEGKTITVFPDGRAIIKGTDDIAAARVLYARYVGQ
ncbi:MAG TPA: ThiF family adenylyltransferase [Thermoleophilia bacterium]|nr:ThiF family adenylyltransferase [Thermoleophilia bacterium]